MEKKIDIAELLKDCPSGMELDCTTWFNVTFEKVVNDEIYIKRNNKAPSFEKIVVLNKYGCCTSYQDEKCRIFPKGKTTWEGFVPPCQFNDGDILAVEHGNIAIYKGTMWYNKKLADYYCGYRKSDNKFLIKTEKDGHFGFIEELHYASEEEKQKLFDVIKDNGYKWNVETKTLEKLVEPKFKVGDRIRSVISLSYYTIVDIKDDQYVIKPDAPEKFPYNIDFSLETNYELVHKFDITTLKPFESKVLVRDSEAEKWKPAIWGYYDSDETYDYPYEVVGGIGFSMCIPYEDNKHLRGKTDDCSSFYKTWE